MSQGPWGMSSKSQVGNLDLRTQEGEGGDLLLIVIVQLPDGPGHNDGERHTWERDGLSQSSSANAGGCQVWRTPLQPRA
jgi:hypothetical protein